MYKWILEAILYNSCGCELDRKVLNEADPRESLVSAVRDWEIGDGDVIKLESRKVKKSYYEGMVDG